MIKARSVSFRFHAAPTELEQRGIRREVLEALIGTRNKNQRAACSSIPPEGEAAEPGSQAEGDDAEGDFDQAQVAFGLEH